MKDIEERKMMVLAMEFIVRQINNEEILIPWLMGGVADGDIEYGCFDPDMVDEYYTEKETFADLMGCFLRRMVQATKDGGLYCGKVVSR